MTTAGLPQDPGARADIAALSYEDARAELVETVHRLETGAASLAESLHLWERGEALADRCESILDGARTRLQARRDSDANPATAPQEESASDDGVGERP